MTVPILILLNRELANSPDRVRQFNDLRLSDGVDQ